MIKNKNFIFSVLVFCLSLLIIYLFIFTFYFINLEKNFEKNFKNYKTFSTYNKYSREINHIRYKDEYRFKEITNELIFNFIKNDPGKKIILFQGDSWVHQINKYESTKKILNTQLLKFSKIINAGTPSYSPSLMQKQFQIIEKDFKIYPNVIVAYIDQTDMGDELCRYKNLIKYNKKGYIESVGLEKYPYHRDVFNLHEKLVFSEIEFKKKNRVFKTQLYINYLIKKTSQRAKKKFILTFVDNSISIKCRWRLIESYKEELSNKDKIYLKNIFRNYLMYLIEKSYVEEIYIVTHPHKTQMTTSSEPINVSAIVSEIVLDLPKVIHLNFSKISEEKNLYENLDNVWDKDTIHLNENGYKIFLKKIVDKIN
jgi:hypothetical protein